MLYIFDWDGTLLDSTGKIVTCMQQAISAMGLPPRGDTAVKQIIGLGLPEAIAQLFPEISASDLERFQQRYSNNFKEADQIPCAFYDGVEKTLQQLREDGHQLAVATGKSRRGLDRVMRNVGLHGFFDATRCADETRSKPHPQMLIELLTELAGRREEALMIGDTSFDLEMAANAGIGSIGVSYGAHPVELLTPHNPKYIIDHFGHLLIASRAP